MGDGQWTKMIAKKRMHGMTKMRSIKSDNRGFTLLEVIIAVSVLTIGILAMGVLQTSSVRLNSNAKGITEASAWATDTMEDIMALAFTDAAIATARSYSTADNNKILYSNHPAIAQGYTIVYTVLNNGPAVGGTATYKTITVTVTWRNLGTSGAQRSVSLNFIKAQLI
jgi:type IV pilus assembly protein PilV